MKTVSAIFLILALLASPAYALVINGSFESGTLDGWDVTIPYGESELRGGTRPAGTVHIVNGSHYDNQAIDGVNMVQIGTGNEYFYTSNQEYLITVSQNVYFNANDILSGSAFFYNGDYTDQDSGWVKIFDEYGVEVATPWIEYSGELPDGGQSTDFMTATEWQSWDWCADVAGNYQIVLGVTTMGDVAFSSYAFFDNIQIQPIPEPSTLTMIGIFSFLNGGLAAYKRRKQ